MLVVFLYRHARQFFLVVLGLAFATSHVLAQPSVIAYSPSSKAIPENTLRLYVTFSDAIKTGQVRDKINLLNSSGRVVLNPFLNLDIELWNKEQTRLTLLFDPGRIKQNVGPNIRSGSALVVGEHYRLVINGTMESVSGEQLGHDVVIHYEVVDAIRHSIAISDWQIERPKTRRGPALIKFDRLMDAAIASRLIAVFDAVGSRVKGSAETDGRSWFFFPELPWRSGVFNIVVHPELEDVSGNTLHAAFDAPAGTIGTSQGKETLSFLIDI